MSDYDPNAVPGVPVPADWVCAFVACEQRADQTHVAGCPYGPTALDRLMRRVEDPLPEATWSGPGDLSRLSIEAMERRRGEKP